MRTPITLIAVAALVAAPLFARPTWGQDRDEPLVRRVMPPEVLPFPRGAIGLELTGGGGAVALAGTAHDAADADYGDLFDTGSLGVIEARLHVGLAERGRFSFDLAPLARLDHSRFDGRAYTDAVGDTYEPDNMRWTRFLVGASVRFRWLDPMHRVAFWIAPHVSVGVVNMAAVDGWLTDDTFRERARLYDPTTTIALDAGVRFGFTLPLGRAADLGLFLGWGQSIHGVPDEVSSPDNALNRHDADGPVAVYVLFGFSLDFGFPRA